MQVGIGRAGLDVFDLAAERAQPVRDQRRDPVESRAVAAAGFNRYQLLERRDKRRLFRGGK